MSDDDDDDDNDDLTKTVQMHSISIVDPTREIDEILGDLERLLKNGDVAARLAEKGINASLALLASQGLTAYLQGRKQQAAEDFQAVSEEISDRLALGTAEKLKPN